MTESLVMNVSHQRLVLAPGVLIQAQRGLFHRSGSHLITIDNVTNVTVSGYGATLQMWKQDYSNTSLYNHSEWRHAISITSAKQIVVEGVTAMSSGGDGINIGGNQEYMGQCRATGDLCDSVNVLIRDVNLTDNFRNALSVTGAVNLTVQRSTLAHTGGK
jgi:hypothetical protein